MMIVTDAKRPLAARPSSDARTGSASADRVRNLVPLLLLAYSMFFLSPEVRVTVAGVNLPAYRLVILAFAIPWLMISERRRVRFGLADLLIVLASVWTLVSFIDHYGYGSGFVRAMGVVIDTAGGYFVARLCIRDTSDLRLFFLLIIPGLAFAGAFMAFESLHKGHVLRPMYASIFGQLPRYSEGAVNGFNEIRLEYRYGFLRAISVFSHPILGGVLLSSTLIVFLNSGIKHWPLYLALISGLCGIFSLSSAAGIAIILSIILKVTDKFIRLVRGLTWNVIVTFTMLVGLGLEVVSNKGLLDLLIRQTLVPQTGYYRKAIWEWGLKSVEKHPVYGIGYAEYERPLGLLPSPSVDAHFLALAIRDGAFVSLAIAFSMAITIVLLGRVVGKGKGPERDMLFGLNCALVILFVASMTVTFFGESLIWFMAMIGAGASLAQCVFMPARKPPESVPLSVSVGALT